LPLTDTIQVTKVEARRKGAFLILLLSKGPGIVIGKITFALLGVLGVLGVLGRRRRGGVCIVEIPLAACIPTVSPAAKSKTTPSFFGGGAAEVEIQLRCTII